MQHETLKIELIELESIDFVLPWQRHEFWQEYHSNRGGSKENLHLNTERTPKKTIEAVKKP